VIGDDRPPIRANVLRAIRTNRRRAASGVSGATIVNSAAAVAIATAIAADVLRKPIGSYAMRF
jgi:hypothetical protein